MLILAAILITLLMPLVVLGLSFTRLRNGYLWTIVTMSTFVAWGLILMSRSHIPISIPIADWQPETIFFASPSLLLDKISWPFAVALMTISLAALLTDVVRVDKLSPQTWAFIQALGGVGLIAVFAGNPQTMLVTWAVIDIVECVVLLLRMSSSRERERVVISISVRIAGMVLLILAMLSVKGLEAPLKFEDIPSQFGGFLMLAAGLRLGVLPTNHPHLVEPLMHRSLGTLIRFVPSGAGMVLLVRAAHVEITGGWFLLIVGLATMTVLLSAIFWFQAHDERQGVLYWIFGFSSFALVAAAHGLQNVSAAWGLAMLFSGALLFLFSKTHRWFMIFPFLGIIGISALPMTPTWEGSALFFAIPWGLRVPFFFAQALMIVGYLGRAQRSKPIHDGFERWMWLVYPVGLTILPITHFSLIYMMWMLGFQDISFHTTGWWSGLISLVVVATILFLNHRRSNSLHLFPSRIVNDFVWIPRTLWWGYRAFGRSLYVVTRILEGDGSVLWALLILILLMVTTSLLGNGEQFGF